MPSDGATASGRAPHDATPCLRKCQQLAWVLGARLSHVGERHRAGELDALRARELLELVRA
eukprot:1476694-Prymnesium_polylepis.1